LIKTFAICLVLALTLVSTAFAQLTPEQQAARDKGLALYQQSDWYDSQPLLQIAAEAGDQQAQYYLGEAIRLSKRYMTAEARKWYEAAAEQGDLFAMLRLSDSSDLCHELGTCALNGTEWREKALDLAYERAEQGDTQAMHALFNAKQGIGWLEKAADGGDSAAQRLLAGLYLDGEGWFFVPGSREEAILSLYQASAEGGYPPGMFEYSLAIAPTNKSEASEWLKKAASENYVNAVIEYAANLGGLSTTFNLAIDRITGHALMKLVVDISPENTIRLEMLKDIEKEMDAKEIERAVTVAEEWEKTHPPLSYFVPVYGF
jgi:uncharacterized protein